MHQSTTLLQLICGWKMRLFSCLASGPCRLQTAHTFMPCSMLVRSCSILCPSPGHVALSCQAQQQNPSLQACSPNQGLSHSQVSGAEPLCKPATAAVFTDGFQSPAASLTAVEPAAFENLDLLICSHLNTNDSPCALQCLGPALNMPRELALYDIVIYCDDSGSMIFEENGESGALALPPPVSRG